MAGPTNANGLPNEITKVSSLLRNFHADGSLRQNSLAIANAMACCTQVCMQFSYDTVGILAYYDFKIANFWLFKLETEEP